LEVFQSLAAKCSKDRAQEFRTLEKATQVEICFYDVVLCAIGRELEKQDQGENAEKVRAES
jgi:hypothetical protein